MLHVRGVCPRFFPFRFPLKSMCAGGWGQVQNFSRNALESYHVRISIDKEILSNSGPYFWVCARVIRNGYGHIFAGYLSKDQTPDEGFDFGVTMEEYNVLVLSKTIIFVGLAVAVQISMQTHV